MKDRNMDDPTMELDQLREQWAAYGARLDESVRMNAALVRELRTTKASSALRRVTRVLSVELLIDIVIVVWLGSFLAANIREPRFVIPALLLDGYAIFMLVATARQFALVHAVDFSAPTIAAQRQLEAVRIARIRMTKLHFVYALLLWTPMLIVGIRATTGIDPYRFLDPAWLAANFVLGIVAIPLMLWLARRYADRVQSSPRLQRFVNDLAGRSLARATAFLAELSALERGEERGQA